LENRRQKTEDRLSGYQKIRMQVIRPAGYQVKEQKTEVRRQKTEGRRKKTEGRRQRTGYQVIRKSGCRASGQQGIR